MFEFNALFNAELSTWDLRPKHTDSIPPLIQNKIKNQSLGASGLENIRTQPLAYGIHYRQEDFLWGFLPAGPRPHSRRGDCKQRLFQSTLVMFLGLIVFVHCKLCVWLCPWGQRNWRARWEDAGEGPEPTMKHNRPSLLSLWRTRGASPPEQQRNKMLFFFWFSNSCAFKGFKSWNKTDLASALYLFFWLGGRGGEWGSW